jgi:hypothetical protein
MRRKDGPAKAGFKSQKQMCAVQMVTNLKLENQTYVSNPLKGFRESLRDV